MREGKHQGLTETAQSAHLTLGNLCHDLLSNQNHSEAKSSEGHKYEIGMNLNFM